MPIVTSVVVELFCILLTAIKCRAVCTKFTFNFDITTLLFILISDICQRRRVLRACQHVSSVWVSQLLFCFFRTSYEQKHAIFFIYYILSLDRSISMVSLRFSVCSLLAAINQMSHKYMLIENN